MSEAGVYYIIMQLGIDVKVAKKWLVELIPHMKWNRVLT